MLVFALCTITIILCGDVSSTDILGPQNKSVLPLIIGGYEARIEDHPYQVSFVFNDFNRNESGVFCGGFIVSQYHIITAAHCLEGPGLLNVTIRAGSRAWRHGGITIDAAYSKICPDYNKPKPHDNDVAVVKTLNPIPFDTSIQPIKLPEENVSLVDDSIVTVSGWGLVNYEDYNSPEYLRAVQIPVINFDKCKKAHEVIRVVVTDNMWCGGYLETGGKGACSGDSGGAAVQNGVAYGIASWNSEGCVEPYRPNVYVRVSAPTIRRFIREQTGL